MRIWLVVLIILVGGNFGPACAEESVAEAPADTTAGRFHQQGLGGPASPGATLEKDDESKKSMIGRLPVVYMAPWFDWKHGINKRHGLQFGANYQATFTSASASLTPDGHTSASGGVLNIPIVWTPNQHKKNRSVFTLTFEGRHTYSAMSPQNLAFATGSGLPIATKFGELDFRVWLLHYGQFFLDGRLGVVVGKIAPDDYFTHYQLMHPFLNFLGFSSVISPAGNWMNPGFGVGAGYVTTQIYFKGAVMDVAGDAGGSDFLDWGDNFFHGRVQAMAEVGWVPSWESRYSKRLAFTVWHTDAHDGYEEDFGAALTSNWTVAERWVPFLLGGVSKGKAANSLAEATVTLGTGYNFGSHDVLGVSANWNSPAGMARDQYTLEAFYRFYLSERLALSPDVQWVINPSLNSDEDSILYLQLRARIDI